ncbi:exocyst complex component exo70 [Gnomoniopsis smithogilvyi]|uniref:Exocyst complex protein EXO70 n=1 Tax=Gnomoniopsis smithogilvyi TaxID=1191159 RepID=A0A9W8YLW2_9PEZI|nr:exocyst complex component exo70 [Gnomoniopsis smithogilvyi]
MAVRDTISRQAAEEEAEVDVLKSHLETRAQMTKKIDANRVKVEDAGRKLDMTVASLGGETKKLQDLLKNIRAALSALDNLNKQAESKNDEESTIRMGPEKAGLTSYISSLKRLRKTLASMKSSNLRSTQDTVADLQRLIKSGNTQLEAYFDKLLRSDTPRSIEPLHYTTKNEPFPILSEDKNSKLGVLNDYISDAHKESGIGDDSAAAKIYAEVRGQYLQFTLANLASASINMAKRKDPTTIYRTGMSGIGMYAQAMEGLFRAEYENICRVFTRADWGPTFLTTTTGAITELARVLRELNLHIKQHLATDCFLGFETVEVITTLANNLEQATGELKGALTAALKPIKETAKSSLAELLVTMKQKISGLATLPQDGAPIPVAGEAIRSLQGMVDFLRPVSSIMISIGDGGWKSVATARGAPDMTPNLSSFDVTADGREIFAHYCTDTVETLLAALDARARMLFGKKPVVGVFMANSIMIVERMIRESELWSLLDQRLPPLIDAWRKKSKGLYLDMCKDVSVHLLDTIHTSRAQRPTSGQGAVDSASIMKGLSSKDRDNIKQKFLAFNASFDEMVKSHKSFNMEPEVRRMFARDVQQTVEPLYNRFFDRYHEVDKGKGKYVKYDKAQIAGVFNGLY